MKSSKIGPFLATSSFQAVNEYFRLHSNLGPLVSETTPLTTKPLTIPFLILNLNTAVSFARIKHGKRLI